MRDKRLLGALVLGLVLPSAGRADEPAPEAPRAHLVGVILSTAQALLWDEERSEYFLARVGEELRGGRIVELDADHIVLQKGEARELVEMSAPPTMRVAVSSAAAAW